jgi:hypothetical protein
MIADEILDFRLALPNSVPLFLQKRSRLRTATTAKSASAAAEFRRELRYGFRNFAEGYY